MPLVLALRLKGLHTPHLMVGHHQTTRVRVLQPKRRITHVLVHSKRRHGLAVRDLRIPHDKVALEPYGIDATFWSPATVHEERLVVSVGREHQDYTTLAEARGELPVRVFVAAGSLSSLSARHDQPQEWPANFKVGFAEPSTVRDMYGHDGATG